MTAPDVVRAGVLDLVPPYWGKPRITSLLVALLNQVQFIEDAIDAVNTIRTIGGADLERLRILGRILGEPRLDRELERYRTALRARARANRSRGRLVDLVNVSEVIFGPLAAIIEGPRSVLLAVPGPTTASVADAIGALRDAKPAGIALGIVAFGPDDLTLDGPAGTVPDSLTYAGSGATDWPLAFLVAHTSW